MSTLNPFVKVMSLNGVITTVNSSKTPDYKDKYLDIDGSPFEGHNPFPAAAAVVTAERVEDTLPVETPAAPTAPSEEAANVESDMTGSVSDAPTPADSEQTTSLPVEETAPVETTIAPSEDVVTGGSTDTQNV